MKKNRRWTAHDKGKMTTTENLPDSVGVESQRNSGNNGWTFVAVIVGLPDVNKLPEPVIKGGITRVVIPQAAYEKQIAKYKMALIGRFEDAEVGVTDNVDDPVIYVDPILSGGATLTTSAGRVVVNLEDFVSVDDTLAGNEDGFIAVEKNLPDHPPGIRKNVTEVASVVDARLARIKTLRKKVTKLRSCSGIFEVP
ncbi:hypothetical protein NE237_031713 [Protea cynaroides]|uniref:Uncharacterized protein n=1 Tax=Protea cynaroides TaxID=273540 RepID=A0A9Q0L235_9MAGN|nr:hypothetical protein NE237_031713 [Protea cynaroides]